MNNSILKLELKKWILWTLIAQFGPGLLFAIIATIFKFEDGNGITIFNSIRLVSYIAFSIIVLLLIVKIYMVNKEHDVIKKVHIYSTIFLAIGSVALIIVYSWIALGPAVSWIHDTGWGKITHVAIPINLTRMGLDFILFVSLIIALIKINKL